MKKIILAVILSISAILQTAVFAENDEITVTINGEKLESPIPAQIINERTMLPMRSVFETLGAKVTWAGDDKLIFATKGKIFITMKIGVPQMVVQTTDSDESEVITLDTAPFIDSDYTLIPVRAVAEALSADVDWIDETRTVVITNSKGTLD